MGLNAVVYRNLANLPDSMRERVRFADPNMGELEFLPTETSDSSSRAALIAGSARLGNIAMIAWLREEIASRCAACPLLMKLVLYSGTHCGDSVAVHYLASLEHEVNAISSAAGSPPDELTTFLETMRSLIERAKQENNPIVFV
jgi:hypothetical protein